MVRPESAKLHKLLILWISLAGAGCGGEGGSPVEDGDRDGGVDAGGDGGVDAGRDGGPRLDGGRDGGVHRANWRRLDVGPSFCTWEQAANPGALLDLGWVACDEMPGCQRLPHDALAQRAFNDLGYTHDGLGHFETVLEDYDDHQSRRMNLTASTEQVLGAWRSAAAEGICTVGAAHAAHGRVALRMHANSPLKPDETGSRVLLGEIGGELRQVALERSIVEAVFVGPTVVFAALVGRHVAYDADGGRHVLGGIGSSFGGDPVTMVPVGDDLFWEDWADRSAIRVVHSRVGQESQVLLPAPADGRRIRGFQADEDWMAWQVLDPVEDTGVEIWAAPFTTDPEAVSARKVAEVPLRGLSSLGGGHYTVGMTPAAVVNLETGQVRAFDDRPLRPFGRYTPDALYVTTTEAAFLMRETATTFNIWRLEIDELPILEP